MEVYRLKSENCKPKQKKINLLDENYKKCLTCAVKFLQTDKFVKLCDC